MRKTEATHLAYIDGLRGIAILMVLSSHAFLYLTPPSPWLLGSLKAIVCPGMQGVQLFFFLSAFTLFSSLITRSETESHPLQNFYLRRVFRILPLWWVTVGLTAYLSGANWHRIWINASFAYGFTRFQPNTDLVTGQWSLFVEETFYLILPWIFTRLKTLPGAVNLFLTTFLAQYFWNHFSTKLGVPSAQWYVEFFPLNHYYCFAMGIFGVYIWQSASLKRHVFEDPKWRGLLNWTPLLLLPLLIPEPLPYSTLGPFTLFIASFSGGTWAGKLTRTRWLGWYGRSCYSIYLLHFLWIVPLSRWLRPFFTFAAFHRWPGEMQYLTTFLLFAGINLITGVLVYTLVEKPFMRLGKRIIAWRETPPPQLELVGEIKRKYGQR